MVLEIRGRLREANKAAAAAAAAFSFSRSLSRRKHHVPQHTGLFRAASSYIYIYVYIHTYIHTYTYIYIYIGLSAVLELLGLRIIRSELSRRF
jgi:hypothetical protein